MNLINIENITKHFTDTPVFDNASFTLDEHEKVGVIGVNGTGKTTFLRLIAGLEDPESGTITRARNLKIRYLSQSPVFQDDMTALQCVMENNLDHTNEWTLEADAKSMLQKLGLPDYDAKAGTLSGGQRKRLALANTLLSKADILLLDEPTNHLDSFMADWLEEYLKAYNGALVMVTHDRYFLDSVSSRIVEIDHSKIYSYDTNYLGFIKLKAEREDMELAAQRKRHSILRTEIEWMMRGARARSTKQKAHIQRYENLAAVKDIREEKKLELSSISTRMGRTTVELNGVSKTYGDRTLFKDFSYIFLKNDRVGFIGENGSGKTTLMKIIAGFETSDTGSVTLGQTIKLGYYAQEFKGDPKDGLAYMDPELKVIDYIRNTAEYVRTTDGLVSASVMLDRFLFPPEKQHTLLKKLSGGEKRRLNLLRVLMEAPNVLILDEPTNDLDIQTLTILEDYLDTFDGIVITVSHDRYFLDRVVRRIFSFENGSLKQYEGGYTDYLATKGEQEAESLPAAKKPENKPVQAPQYVSTHEAKLKFSYKEQREFDTIDDDIAKLEEAIARKDKEMEENATSAAKLSAISQEKDELQAQLDEKMERWMYLNELYEKIQAQNH